MRKSFDKLKEHSKLQTVRCEQLSSASDGTRKQLKELLATSKEVSADIDDLQSQMNGMSRKIEAQVEKMEQNTVWILLRRNAKKTKLWSVKIIKASIEAEHVRIKTEYMSRLQKSRTNDATIQANDNELKDLIAALNQQKDALAKANHRRTELENVATQTANQMRLVAKDIESLRTARRQCESDHQELQKLELEKSSLRKEIDFYTKTARKVVSKTDQMVGLARTLFFLSFFLSFA